MPERRSDKIKSWIVLAVPVGAIALMFSLLGVIGESNHSKKEKSIQAEQYSPHVVTIKLDPSIQELLEKIDRICGYRNILPIPAIPGSIAIETNIENCVDAMNTNQ